MAEHRPGPCLHEDSVEWNPWNRAVQCHRCGQVIVDVAALEMALMDIEGHLRHSTIYIRTWQIAREALATRTDGTDG